MFEPHYRIVTNGFTYFIQVRSLFRWHTLHRYGIPAAFATASDAQKQALISFGERAIRHKAPLRVV